jgi:hypothetical protein
VRLTVPPAEPLAPNPVYRGQAPGPGEQGQRFAGPQGTPVARPGYLPDYPASAPSGWQPNQPPAPTYMPVPVRLGPPQFGPGEGPAPAAAGQASPVGFPR